MVFRTVANPVSSRNLNDESQLEQGMCYNTRRLTDVETVGYNAAKLILRFDRLAMKAMILSQEQSGSRV